MTETKIQWCDFSSNLLKYRDADGKTVWACAKVSDGCKNCYAESMAHRYQKGGPFTLQQVKKVTPYFDEKEAALLLRSKKLTGKRVFIDDMTDLFGEWVSDEIIDKHFAVFALRPDAVFQVLTKRPERMAKYLASHDVGLRWVSASGPLANLVPTDWPPPEVAVSWTNDGLPNVWLGTSCENQQTADERIPHLLKFPAAVRFISAEPLLGSIDLSNYLIGHEDNGVGRTVGACLSWTPPIDWVIVGGESGAKARPCDLAWINSIRKQCDAGGVACFVKQVGSKPENTDPELRCGGIRDHKGGDPSEWPEDLRVRQMPETVLA